MTTVLQASPVLLFSSNRTECPESEQYKFSQIQLQDSGCDLEAKGQQLLPCTAFQHRAADSKSAMQV